MLNIYIARHGQNVDNANGILNGHRDEPLTELGLEQAKTTAAHIKETGLKFDAVYCSPLERAKRTAEIICNTLSQEAPIVQSDLTERDFGDMTGKPISSIKELCAPNILETGLITYFLSSYGGETFPDVLQRAKNLLTDLQQKHHAGSILLATHGDMGKMIYAAYYNLEWKEVLTDFHFGNCELLLLSPNPPADTAHVFEQEQHNH